MGGIFISAGDVEPNRTPVLYRMPLLGWLFKRDTTVRRQPRTADLHHTTHSEGLRSMNRAHIVEVRVSRKAVWGGGVERLTRLIAVLALTALSASCGDAARQGTGSSYLIIRSLLGASGAAPGSSLAARSSRTW